MNKPAGSFSQVSAIRIVLTLVTIAIFGLLTTGVFAQETLPEDVETEMTADGIFSAPVVIDGETLFLVRGFSALPAVERAASIEKRTLEIAELPDFVELDFEVSANEFGLAVTVNGRLLTVVTEADADFEQIDIEVLAELHAEALKKAVADYRLGRSDAALIESAIAAVAWTVGFVFLTLLFLKQRKHFDRLAGAVDRPPLYHSGRGNKCNREGQSGWQTDRLCDQHDPLDRLLVCSVLLSHCRASVLCANQALCSVAFDLCVPTFDGRYFRDLQLFAQFDHSGDHILCNQLSDQRPAFAHG